MQEKKGLVADGESGNQESKEKEATYSLPQTTENVKTSTDKINRIFEYILKESESAIIKNPIYGFLPNDIEQAAAFGIYFQTPCKIQQSARLHGL